jgi:GT2 family glycosyltransferase
VAGARRLPFAAAVLRTAEQAPGEVLLLLGPGAATDAESLEVVVAAFEAEPTIAAVLPRIIRVGEVGGGEQGDGTSQSLRPPDETPAFGCVALRAALVPDLSVDPGLDDPVAVVAQILAQLRSQELGVVSEPRWTVTVSGAVGPPGPDRGPVAPLGPTPAAAEPAAATPAPAGGGGRTRTRTQAHGERLVVVSGTLATTFSPWSDAGVEDLLGAIATISATTDAALLVAEAARDDPAVARLRARGVEVVVGAADSWRWLHDRAYRLSHLIVTDGALRSGLVGHALESQPQAAKVLWTSTLPFRAVEGMLPVTPYRERAGHEYVRSAVAARAEELVRRFDRVWSTRGDDYRYLSGQLAAATVRLLRRPIAERPVASGIGFDDRSGLVVVACPGADIDAGHEDAAVCAADEIFAHLHRRDARLRLAVVADRPSPMVARLGRQPGVVLATAGADGGQELLAQARVILAPYRHGIGGRAAIFAALGAGTPFLVTATGAAGVELGDIGADAVVDDPLAMTERAYRLHGDRDRWERQHRGGARLVAESYQWATFVTDVGDALSELGVHGRAPGPRWAAPGRFCAPSPGIGPMALAGSLPGDPLPTRPPPLRVAPRAGAGRADAAAELGENERYRLWCATLGPTPAVLASLRAAVRGLPYQPIISIVTPVYNTDPALLETTVASVRAQIYPHWEWCLADDGSSRTDTREVLAALSGDPRIHVTRLDQQSGIVAASNAAMALASGDFLTFVDHDDLLKPHALAQVARWLNHDPELDVLYSDEDKIDRTGQLLDPYWKPDWSPDLLMSRNYINHLLVVRRALVEKLGGLRPGFDGSQDYDLLLRLTEQTDRIAHIPEPLYSWRIVEGSAAAEVDAKPYAFEAARRALNEALHRRGVEGSAENGLLASTYHTRYAIPGHPRVSIIIPTRDRVELLRRCVDSIRAKTAYRNYEIVVIDNDSRDPKTLEYLSTFPGRVIRYPATFNYARMLNLAVQSVDCEALLFLNNDTEVINGDWLEALLEHAMRPEVGAVGCRLYYPDGRLQHEGILVGMLGVAANVDHGGFWALGDLVRNCSAVTGACVMMRSAVYWAIGGNDERLRVAYNDVDICLRIRQAGYQVVYTPYARLFHFEGASRAGYEHADDRAWFTTRWRQFEEWDPYYNPNFDRRRLFKIAL